MTQKKIAVVLASGGLDSAVTTAIAAQDHEVAMLHLNYGQRTVRRELQAFEDLALHFAAAKKMVISIEHLAKIGGSSLTDEGVPVSTADLENPDVPSSYVPFRNANLLAIATSWAEVLGAGSIFVGAVAEDSSGYPDCRREFYDAFEKVIDVGTKPETQIQIVTPIIGLKKWEIVERGAELGVPFGLTWSCYQREDEACGVCDSCGFRLRGFKMAGIEDPIPYAKRPVYE